MSNSTSPIEHGYLVLADISGYTSFLSQTELDHAHEILTDLLETILKRFRTLLTICKLEGDTVFAFTPESRVLRGETLQELIEATYTDFRERMKNVRRHTTCTCNACRNIPSLDLKFIVHHGSYLLQTVRSIVELIGSDVNLAHRLMKNRVSESTGWCAYALFTGQALEQLKVTPEKPHIQFESYEHLGEVTTQCINLRERYAELVKIRRVFLLPEDAHRVLEYDYVAAPKDLWEWFNDPRKRGQWMHSEVRPILRIGGRFVPGARNHCVHGKNEVVVEDLLDIKPFEYYTVEHRLLGSPGVLRMTFQFIPKPGGGTHFRLTLHFRGRFLPDWAARVLGNRIIENNITRVWTFDRIDDLIAKDSLSTQNKRVPSETGTLLFG